MPAPSLYSYRAISVALAWLLFVPIAVYSATSADLVTRAADTAVDKSAHWLSLAIIAALLVVLVFIVNRVFDMMAKQQDVLVERAKADRTEAELEILKHKLLHDRERKD
jgi:TRAP-type C4-dicarboxylate transport system permease small subunit